jgi:hypothetical protein
MLIRDTLQRDLNTRIEEVIQVGQDNSLVVYNEIREYVATMSIKRQFKEVLTAILDSPKDLNTNFEVWISGFFGSGKSSFAKLIGYVLSNPLLHFVQDGKERDQHAAELIKLQFDDPGISSVIDVITAQLPFESIMFDVQTDRNMRDTSDELANIMYRKLLQHLDYCQDDLAIANLEISLEKDGTLAQFIARSESVYDKEWKLIRKSAGRRNQASRILHELYPDTYPSADTWALTINQSKDEERVTVALLVERAFELMQVRRPGRALAFVIDEVGQFVATSRTRIENLRSIVETFGRESVNRVQRGQVPAPVWTIITSQEQLDKLVNSLDSRIMEIAKVQDRFRHRVDLAATDIQEVVSKRILDKRTDALPALHDLYTQGQGKLNIACRLENTTRYALSLNEVDFTRYYPYLPHYIDLSIDIVSGLRIQRSEMRHIGGANRTLIKQAHAMLVSDRTDVANQSLGTLVTIDKIYELVESSISSETSRDIGLIAEKLGGQTGWPARVAKTIVLLMNVRDLPRSEQNLAALLVDHVGDTVPVSDVHNALSQLETHQFIRQHRDGYRLLTAIERSWDDERHAIAEPTIREQNDIRNERILEIFNTSTLKTYRMPPRTFKVKLSIDERAYGSGEVDLRIIAPYTPEDFARQIEIARETTRLNSGTNALYWGCLLSERALSLICEIYQSQQMINKYQLESGSGATSLERKALVDEEKQHLNDYQRQLHEVILRDLAAGVGIFRAVEYQGNVWGREFAGILHQFFSTVLPDVYPKFAIGTTHTFTERDIDAFLKAANLRALSSAFYDGDEQALVIKQADNDYIPNSHAPLPQEVLQHLQKLQKEGIPTTGKALIEHFADGPIYGWANDAITVALVVLLRAGAIEIVLDGQRFSSHQEPQVRKVFESPQSFKRSSFLPRRALDRRVLRDAALVFESLTGRAVDAEVARIAEAMRQLIGESRSDIREKLVVAESERLALVAPLREYLDLIDSLAAMKDDDLVKSVADQGTLLKQSHQVASRISTLLTHANVGILRTGRQTLERQWNTLIAEHPPEALDAQANQLHEILASPESYEQLATIERLSRELQSAYSQIYRLLHVERAEAYQAAIETILASDEYAAANPTRRDKELHILEQRACIQAELKDADLECQLCHATLFSLHSDIDIASHISNGVLKSLAGLALPPPPSEPVSPANYEHQPIQRGSVPPRIQGTRLVRIADFFTEPLITVEQVDIALTALRDLLVGLIEAGDRVEVK